VIKKDNHASATQSQLHGGRRWPIDLRYCIINR